MADKSQPKITAAEVAADGKSVRLRVNGLVKGHVHELKAAEVKNSTGENLLHGTAYYTLNQIPGK